MSEILFADDDEALRTMVTDVLTAAGFTVRAAENGTRALEEVRRRAPDQAILDYRMGTPDGFQVCSEIKSDPGLAWLPVLILTAERSIEDRLGGFDAGADDYLAKPFDPRELALRIRTILRRTAPPPPALLPQAPVQLGMRWFDAERSELRGPDGTIRLTGGEAALLAALARRPGEVLSREDIAAALGTPEAGERAVDVQVTRLRRKIEPDPREPRFLHTVRHRGYVLRPGP
jgi:two-component system phosphate regulon response regulator OmpR